MMVRISHDQAGNYELPFLFLEHARAPGKKKIYGEKNSLAKEPGMKIGAFSVTTFTKISLIQM